MTEHNKKIAVVLSGCGFLDGSEIHESVTTLLHIVKLGATPLFYAPDAPQKLVKNHATQNVSGERRNMLIESARIARSAIKSLTTLTSKDADAMIFPGGFGAANNLSDFADKGADCLVLPDVSRVILDFHQAKKPLGFICIAPCLAAKVLGDKGVEITIGNDKTTADKIEKLGAHHFVKAATKIHVDESLRVVTTPAYMNAKNIAEVDEGVGLLVKAILKMC